MNAFEGLQHFQSPATAPTAPQQSMRIGLRLHPDLPWMVLPAGVPSQLAIDPVLAPVPNVKPWFLGVLNLRGNLVPIFDIGLWQGRDPLSVLAHVLVISPGSQALGVACCQSPALIAVRAGSRVPDSDPMVTLSAFQFQGPEGVVYEMDVQGWSRRVGRSLPGRIE